MALVEVAMEDAPKTTEMNNVLLNRQRKAKRLKLEIAKEKILQKATENYIEAVVLLIFLIYQYLILPTIVSHSFNEYGHIVGYWCFLYDSWYL